MSARESLIVAAVLTSALGLWGCDDNSGQVTGPPVTVHCQNQAPQGSADPTVRVTCPPPS